MYIRTDINGNIELISTKPNVGCVLYKGELPTDFMENVGLGKFRFVKGKPEEVTGWVNPNLKSKEDLLLEIISAYDVSNELKSVLVKYVTDEKNRLTAIKENETQPAVLPKVAKK